MIFTTQEEVDNFDYEKHIDHLADLANLVEFGKVTVLTGSNSSGKSLLRKMTQFDGTKTASISMDMRTQSNAEFGALGGMMCDLPWLATSVNSIHLFNKIASGKEDSKYLVIDEPEIGLSEESTVGLMIKLNKWLDERRNDENFKGVMIITHSRSAVANLEFDLFINIDSLTSDEYINRKIEPQCPELLSNFGSRLHREVQNRINDNKKKKNQ